MVYFVINKKWAIILLGYFLLLITLSFLAYNRMIPSIIAKIPYYDDIGHFVLFMVAIHPHFNHLVDTCCGGRRHRFGHRPWYKF